MYLTLLMKILIFFNNSFLLRLSARQNFNSFANLSTLLVINRSNSIDEENNQSVLKKNVKRKIILEVFRQKIVAHKLEFKVNFRKQDRKIKTKFTDKVKRRRFKSED